MNNQHPGRRHTFICKKDGLVDSGVLPKRRGTSNGFAIWRKAKTRQGGSWMSRRFANIRVRAWREGLGGTGLLGRMLGVLLSNRGQAKNSHASPDIRASELVIMWRKQRRICALCGCFPRLKLLGYGTHLHHNHKTGKVVGFVHGKCNRLEGAFGKLPKQGKLNLLKRLKEST